LMNLKM